MNRRKFLTVVGGGAVLAAGLGAGAFYGTRTPTGALQPWIDAGTLYQEPRRKALSYAILAPNPHNRQPWLVDLSTPETVVLFADPKRTLPETDPFGRQITIGLGCFLELLRMAAAADGYRVNFSLFPEGEDAARLGHRPVAVAAFTRDPSVTADPLFTHVPARRSHKDPYDVNRPVSTAAMRAIVGAGGGATNIGGSNAHASVSALRVLTHEALELEVRTPRTFRESVDLFRIGRAEIEANPDGIDFSGPLFETLKLAGQFSRELALDSTSTAFQQGLDAVLGPTDTAMAHVWVVTNSNRRTDQINAGRDWLRINLTATSEGISTQPLSQALQEYPEMKPHYDKVHSMLAPDGGTVQMLARLGYAAPVAPSPRWPLTTRLI